MNKTKKDKQWQKEVCKKYGYICQACGKDYSAECYFQGDINQYVCGHHIKHKKSHPELRYDIDNGTCLDFEHHTALHAGQITL